MFESKWCEYCQKDSHNDEECWCTRTVPQAMVGYGRCQLGASLSKITLATDGALLGLLYKSAQNSRNEQLEQSERNREE